MLFAWCRKGQEGVRSTHLVLWLVFPHSSLGTELLRLWILIVIVVVRLLRRIRHVRHGCYTVWQTMLATVYCTVVAFIDYSSVSTSNIVNEK